MASCDETPAEELRYHQLDGGRGQEQYVKYHVDEYHGAGNVDEINNGQVKYTKSNGGSGSVGRSN